jgi:hypothetical protein
MSRARILGIVALGLVAAVAQGLIVFWWWFGGIGSFLGLAGLKSTLIPLGVEAVVAVVAMKELHEQHARNPQVHGMARPASEAEAQAAARGKAKAAPVHDQRFPD